VQTALQKAYKITKPMDGKFVFCMLCSGKRLLAQIVVDLFGFEGDI
jgi:hypothetical protein